MNTPPILLTELAERVERVGTCRETDAAICLAIKRPSGIVRAPAYTTSLDAIRSLGGMVVFASDIGADGLAMVKIVVDTSTTPIIEHTGIAPRLEHAWLAAALRARAASESPHG